MSSSNTKALGPPAKISEATFIGTAWGGVGLGILFLIFRVLVRLKIFGRLHLDDGLVFFAWVLLLINTILWQSGKNALYQNIAVSAGQLYPPPPNFEHNSEQYLRKSVAVIIFFYTGLWSVKLSFMIFFRRLGHNVTNQHIVWWTVLAITAASYFACIGDTDYRCLASSFAWLETHCGDTPRSKNFSRRTLRGNMALDVVTDVLIILVPVNLLRKVRLSVRKKFALGGIFSITVIIMIFAIIRAIVIGSYSSEPDESWLYMWSSIEQAVSIMVACIAAFPSLFKKSERGQHERLSGSESRSLWNSISGRFVYFRKKHQASKEIDMDDLGGIKVGDVIDMPMDSATLRQQDSKASSESKELIIPVERVHIGV